MTRASDEQRQGPVEAYLNEGFLTSASARALRIFPKYLEAKSRFYRYEFGDTIVFMGSARIAAREQAQRELEAAERGTIL
jgi:hypothetical protein